MKTLVSPVRSELREAFTALDTGGEIQIENYPRQRIYSWAQHYGVRCSVKMVGAGFRVVCLERFAPPPNERPRQQRRTSLRERMDRLDVLGGLALTLEEWEPALVAIRVFEKQSDKRFRMQRLADDAFEVVRDC